MKFKILKTFAAIIFVGGFMMALKSCKKVDTESTMSETTRAFRQKIGSEGFQTVININKKSESWEYLDKNGNVIKLKSKYQSRPDGTPSVCDGVSCTDAVPELEGSDINSPDIYLKSATRTFSQCARGFYISRLDVTWEASVPFSILTQSPSNATLKSKGRITIKNITSWLTRKVSVVRRMVENQNRNV